MGCSAGCDKRDGSIEGRGQGRAAVAVPRFVPLAACCLLPGVVGVVGGGLWFGVRLLLLLVVVAFFSCWCSAQKKKRRKKEKKNLRSAKRVAYINKNARRIGRS
jgi:uncharacterized membrane protein